MKPLGHERTSVTLHTDGGCQGNPGVGAWAAVLVSGRHRLEIRGAESATTNNRMELTAAIRGLRALNRPCDVTLWTDSEYLRNGITRWIHGWKTNGWRTTDKKPVKNRDLWQALDEAAAAHRIQWQWLKGHAGHAENERCDRLASEAMAQLRRDTPRHQLEAALTEFRNRPDA